MSSVEASSQSQATQGYKRLKVWQQAHKLALAIYKLTESLPAHEQYGLRSQLRRAAVSVPTNIVEGQACRTDKEFLNFLTIANRSLVEVEYLLELSKELEYIKDGQFSDVDRLRSEVGKILNGFRRSLSKT